MINDPEKRQLVSLSLDGRLAIVIGASQGIGKTLAIAMSAAGAELIISSRRREALHKVEDEIKSSGGICTTLPLNVHELHEIELFAAEVRERVQGNTKPLILVYSAGFDLTKPVLQVTEADWDSIFDTHLKGLFFMCQAIGSLMMDRGYGKIINLSSTWSFSTDPGKSVYCAAKAAVSHLTSALAVEWAPHGVLVNAIAPTATLTPPTVLGLVNKDRANRLLGRIPMGRFALPDDIVGAALFLASSASDFITGHTLFVDGGWRASA